MDRYDIAIIGTGPAGLEAAITAKIRNKNILLLGSSKLSTKVEKAHAIDNYLGLPHIAGESMQEAFTNHLSQMGISIIEDKALAVYSMGDYFSLQGHKDIYEATTVILACGMSVDKPLPGELENLGRGVSYCATCDAMFYRGKTAIVVGFSHEAEEEAMFLSEVAGKVIYIPMYQELKSEALRKAATTKEEEEKVYGNLLDLHAAEKLEESTKKTNGLLEVICGEKVVSMEKTQTGIILHLQEQTVEGDGIFILRESVAPSQLVPGLAIENNQVVVDRQMKTNIAGLFACGDLTGAPYQYIKAAGEGNVAALSAVKYLAELIR